MLVSWTRIFPPNSILTDYMYRILDGFVHIQTLDMCISYTNPMPIREKEIHFFTLCLLSFSLYISVGRCNQTQLPTVHHRCVIVFSLWMCVCVGVTNDF